MYAHFVDFEKAFDSVHRKRVWNIMTSYGIPDNMRVIAGIYEGFECTVVDGSVTSDWFMIKSIPKQGFVMSGFLFLLGLDWVMRKAPTDKRRGIRWNFTSLLEDLISQMTLHYCHLPSMTGMKDWEIGRGNSQSRI